MGKWEVKMEKQRDLKKRGIEALHERVKLLVECFDDLEFLSWCEESSTNELDYLDKECEDVGYDFLTLRDVFNDYPEVEDWRSRGLRSLLADIIRKDKKEGPAKKRTNWKAKAEELEKECSRLKGELLSQGSGDLRAEFDEERSAMQQEVEQLRYDFERKCERLRAENAGLQKALEKALEMLRGGVAV